MSSGGASAGSTRAVRASTTERVTSSGAWITKHAVSREPGLLPYVYVEDLDATVALVEANGGEIVDGPAPEGNLVVATFCDPAGNVMGLWQAAD